MTDVENPTRLGLLEHRNRVLASVTEIASYMAASHNIDAVLDHITVITRNLTRSDMAYISINDAKETFIKYSTGVRTKEYRQIRMPLGTGVLGKAAVGRGIVQTSDYLVDPAVIHLTDIDEAVRLEGARAILGVPIMIHGTLHGALLVANRTPGAFPPHVIDTVATIALHTAVTLDHAQRFNEVSTALAGLRETVHHSNEQLDALHDVVNVDALLSEALTQRVSVEDFAETAALALGSPLVILDGDGRVMARGNLDADHKIPAFAADLGRSSYIAGRALIRQGVTAAAATSNSEHIGTVIVFDEVARQLLPRVARTAVFLGILLLFERARRGEERQRDQALFDDLLKSRPLAPSGKRRMAALLSRGPASVAVLQVHNKPEESARSRLAGAIADCATATGLDPAHYIAVDHHEHLCLLIPQAVTDSFLATVIETSDRVGLPVQCAIGGTIAEASSFPAVHGLAMTSLGALTTLGITSRVQKADSLGILGVILAAQSENPYAPSPLAQIQDLISYDSAHTTELTRTAWVYAECRSNIRDTASTLVVHDNTVRQRLARIADIIGDDWQDSRRFLDIHLGLRAWALKHEAHLHRPSRSTPPA